MTDGRGSAVDTPDGRYLVVRGRRWRCADLVCPMRSGRGYLGADGRPPGQGGRHEGRRRRAREAARPGSTRPSTRWGSGARCGGTTASPTSPGTWPGPVRTRAGTRRCPGDGPRVHRRHEQRHLVRRRKRRRPRRVAAFWCQVLGWETQEVFDGGVAIGPPAGRGRPTMDVVLVTDEKRAERRTSTCGPRARPREGARAAARARGRRVDVGQPADATWVVLADRRATSSACWRAPPRRWRLTRCPADRSRRQVTRSSRGGPPRRGRRSCRP